MHRILRIFRAPQQETLGRSRKFSVSEYLFSFFVVQYRAYENLSFFSFFLSISKKGERLRARTFLPAIYSLLLENLEMIQGSRSRCVRYVNIRDVEKSHWRFTGHVVLNKYKGRELDRFHVGIIVIDLLLAPRRLRNKMFFLLTFPHLASHLFFSQTLSKIPDLSVWNLIFDEHGMDSIRLSRLIMYRRSCVRELNEMNWIRTIGETVNIKKNNSCIKIDGDKSIGLFERSMDFKNTRKRLLGLRKLCTRQ